MSTAQIPLRARDGSIRAYALVDEADLADVARFRWHLASTGYATRRLPNGNPPGGHASRSPGFNHEAAYKGDTLTLHRYLMGLAKGNPLEVDHINRIKLDNRRSNLRIVDRSQQMQNLAAIGGTSKYRGVWQNNGQWGNGRWVAAAKLNRKNYWLGRYDTEEEAAKVSAEFRRQHMPFSDEAREAS